MLLAVLRECDGSLPPSFVLVTEALTHFFPQAQV